MYSVFRVVLAAVFLLTTTPASAGLVSKGVKIYTTVQIVKVGILLTRYGKQVVSISGRAFDAKQLGLLKQCFVTRSCVTFIKNPQAWSTSLKNKVVNDWERHTGQIWPRYTSDVFNNGVRVARKGDMYEAHHMIPKQIGGPHQWWNMHPVPKPEHQKVIHAGRSFLSDLVAITR